MSTMSIRKMADLILDTIDPYKTGESKYTPQWVREQIIVARNHFRKIDAERSIESGDDIEDDWFTEKEATIQYDADRERFYVTLPNGNVALPSDKGIRVLPYAGSYNPFIRCPANWVSLRPELAFAEGNILWTPISGLIIFPFMQLVPGNGKVILMVIENGVPDDPNAPIPMPDRYEALVMDKVLNDMSKIRGEDRKTDSKPFDAE